MTLKCLKTGFVVDMPIGECRFILNNLPEGTSSSEVVEQKTPSQEAKEGVQNDVVTPLRQEADKKMDDLGRRQKVITAMNESETKARENVNEPKLNQLALYKFQSKDDFLFVNFLNKFEPSLAANFITQDGTLDYSVFAEDTPGAIAIGMYVDAGEWKLKKTWGADWMSADVDLGNSFEQALATLIRDKAKYENEVVKNPKGTTSFFDALTGSRDEYILLMAKTDNDLYFKGTSPESLQANYNNLVENSKKVVSHLSAQPVGWRNLDDRDIFRDALSCGVEAVGSNGDYVYLKVGATIFRKSASGLLEKMEEVTDGSPKTPKNDSDAMYLDNLKGVFHISNFKAASADDLQKAVADDLSENPANYASVLGESADTQSNPDSVKIEQAKNGLFVGDIDINGNSVDVTGAILENKFKEKITAKFKSRFKFSEDPTTKKLIAEKPEEQWNVDHKDVIVASIVADLVKKLDDWKLANPKTAAATKLDVKVSPTYTVTGTWKDKKGKALATKVLDGVEGLAKSAEQKVANFLGSKIGQLMLMFGLIDEKKLMNHFKGSPKIPGFEIFAFFAGVGDSKQMDNMAKKHGWLAKLKAKVDGLVAKASEMVGIEGKTEAAKVFTSGLAALSGPLTEPMTLDTQAGDIFGGTVLTANVDFTLNRLVTCRKIGETDWREVQLSNANGYQVKVNQALDDITIPVGVVVGVEAPQAVAVAEEAPAEAVVEATVDPTDLPADAPAETQEA